MDCDICFKRESHQRDGAVTESDPSPRSEHYPQNINPQPFNRQIIQFEFSLT